MSSYRVVSLVEKKEIYLYFESFVFFSFFLVSLLVFLKWNCLNDVADMQEERISIFSYVISIQKYFLRPNFCSSFSRFIVSVLFFGFSMKFQISSLEHNEKRENSLVVDFLLFFIRRVGEWWTFSSCFNRWVLYFEECLLAVRKFLHSSSSFVSLEAHFMFRRYLLSISLSSRLVLNSYSSFFLHFSTWYDTI